MLDDHKYVLHPILPSQVNKVYQKMSELRKKGKMRKCMQQLKKIIGRKDEVEMLARYKETTEEIEAKRLLILVIHKDIMCCKLTISLR